jgi:hypothetical protein
MAQRGAWTPQKVRDRIRTRLLAKRLEDHGLGLNEMTKTQVQAATSLLKKTLPDLQALTIAGDPEAPVRITVTDGNL